MLLDFLKVINLESKEEKDINLFLRLDIKNKNSLLFKNLLKIQIRYKLNQENK